MIPSETKYTLSFLKGNTNKVAKYGHKLVEAEIQEDL